jgi:peptidoglycan hydrolase-like protein with peptidoglycan-binding domain
MKVLRPIARLSVVLAIGLVAALAGATSAQAVGNLSYGSRGLGVSCAQAIINNLGYSSLAVDGIFGPLTKSAVKRFQGANRLYVDGVIGPMTGNKLANFNDSYLYDNSWYRYRKLWYGSSWTYWKDCRSKLPT